MLSLVGYSIPPVGLDRREEWRSEVAAGSHHCGLITPSLCVEVQQTHLLFVAFHWNSTDMLMKLIGPGWRG